MVINEADMGHRLSSDVLHLVESDIKSFMSFYRINFPKTLPQCINATKTAPT